MGVRCSRQGDYFSFFISLTELTKVFYATPDAFEIADPSAYGTCVMRV